MRSDEPTIRKVHRRRIVTTWVDQATADEVRACAADSVTTVSVIIAGVVARYANQLHDLEVPTGSRRVTLASSMPQALADAIALAAEACGSTRSQIVAAALVEGMAAQRRRT